jgi:aldehyde dehydrogenase family 7 protein A1
LAQHRLAEPAQPVAVYGWNLALSMISGNGTVWAPSSSTPLISIATTKLISRVLEANNVDGAVASLVTGGSDVGRTLVGSRDVELVSFTGSELVGKQVGQAVASRFGKSLLELGGNNAAVVMADAELELAVRTVVFGAIGTAGQRCTSTRRLFLHADIADAFLAQLTKAYAQLVPSRIGHPLDEGVLCGPLHSASALGKFERTLEEAKQQGGEIVFGGRPHQPKELALRKGAWVEPTIVRFEGEGVPEVMRTECFAPILYVKTFTTLEEAIELNNGALPARGTLCP